LEWRKLHNEELIDLYSSPNIRGIKWKRVRWAGYVALMGERKNAYCVLVEKPMGKNHLEDLGLDGRIIPRWMFRKWDLGAWTGLFWLRQGPVACSCKRCNEPSGSIKCGAFLD